jgi:predicted Zn-dependent protease with MMP-like domain
VTRRKFEALVERALRRLPRRFRSRVANVVVIVEDWPDEQTLTDLGVEPPDTLFGLYRGVDLTRREGYGNVLPDTITIYQGPIEEEAEGRPAEMAQIVRDTVMHEFGHYFGLDDEELHRIEEGEGEDA